MQVKSFSIDYHKALIYVGDLVRCKDCIHLRIDSDFVEGRYCSIRNVNGGGFCKDEDFCSYGERRENGET